METLLDFSKLGPAIFSIVAIVFVVIKFLKVMSEKDKDMKEIITNHIAHNNEVMSSVKDTISRLRETVKELTIVLRKNGK